MDQLFPVFASRWGYHPCDSEVFLKLRRLHRWYWQTLRDFHRWHRWRRKAEQNRRGPEPRCCPLFIEDRLWYKMVSRRGVRGFKVYPGKVSDLGILTLYREARTPQPVPVPPYSPETCRRIASLHDEAAAYFEK